MTDKKSISLTSIICRNENNLAAEIDDEVMLMSIENGNYYGLDTIAADIWRRLEKPVVVADVCAKLIKEYDANAEIIGRDVLALLEKLSKENLNKVVP